MMDIVERLRFGVALDEQGDVSWCNQETMFKAADEIEQLRKALRDQFAMAALPSVMQKGFLSNDEYAMVAYAMADAMMKAREAK